MVSSVGELDDWRFCPRCGEAIEKNDGYARCGACGFRAWAKPAPGTEAVILDATGRVLLGKRAFGPGAGLWDLPGGFLEEHEDPLAALQREVQEETGLEIEPQALVGFYLEPYDNRTVLCITWLARVTGGRERAGDDLTELRWFARGELPHDELAFSHYRRRCQTPSGTRTRRSDRLRVLAGPQSVRLDSALRRSPSSSSVHPLTGGSRPGNPPFAARIWV